MLSLATLFRALFIAADKVSLLTFALSQQFNPNTDLPNYFEARLLQKQTGLISFNIMCFYKMICIRNILRDEAPRLKIIWKWLLRLRLSRMLSSATYVKTCFSLFAIVASAKFCFCVHLSVKCFCRDFANPGNQFSKYQAS